MKERRKILIGVGLASLLVTIAAIGVAIPEFRKFEEFGMAESVKGYWASLQDFQKSYGRYPSDEAEISAYFETDPGSSPVLYVPPHDDRLDEAILWWKEKTRWDVTVGITEEGHIVKR